MSTEIEIIEQKKQAWGSMAVIIHKSELALQAKAQEVLKKVTLPKDANDIPEHELLLKELKKDKEAIETDRKKITVKFDDLCSRLMLPEKSLNEPIILLQNEIIKLKKESEVESKNEAAKQDEIKRVKEKITTYLAELHAKNLNLINTTVKDLYDYALGAGNISPENIEEFVTKSEGRLTVFDFAIKKINIPAVLVSQEIVNAIIHDIYKPQEPKTYVDHFHALLESQFSDYSVAWLNKEEALKKAAEETDKAIQEVNNQKNNNITASKLESLSSDVIVDPGFKPLKESYEIDMPETLESILAINLAFIHNVNLCKDKLKVNKWFAFTPLQAGIALGKVKSDNNDFNPPGITFKKVNKL
jgi:hypothetical protein